MLYSQISLVNYVAHMCWTHQNMCYSMNNKRMNFSDKTWRKIQIVYWFYRTVLSCGTARTGPDKFSETGFQAGRHRIRQDTGQDRTAFAGPVAISAFYPLTFTPYFTDYWSRSIMGESMSIQPLFWKKLFFRLFLCQKARRARENISGRKTFANIP